MTFDFLRQGAMLAPMAGVTDMPYRVICHELGCPMATSEMVSTKGYLLAPKDSRAVRELLGSGSLLGIPVFGSGYTPIIMIILPAGGFLTLGILMAVFQYLMHKYKKEEN